MAIEHIHSFLVHPRKGIAEKRKIGGTTVQTSGKLFGLLSEIYLSSDAQCDIEIAFNQSATGVQANLCRDLIIDYLEGPTLVRGRRLAERLESMTTRRSGLGLLFVIAGTEGRDHKVVVSRFPTDVAILAEEKSEELSVQFLERVFMKNATSYKAAAYQDSSLKAGFWTGRAVDRQINDRVAQISDYWIADFLASGFQVTSAAGTRILAVAIRNAARATTDINIKSEIAAAVTLAKALKGRRSTTIGFENLLNLSEAAKKLINAQISEHLEDQFQFDWKEFSEHLAYRSIELDNGAILTAEAPRFDEVFHRDRARTDGGGIRFTTEGRITGERLGKSKVERLGK
ncbi:MAG TPA: hypothetical protein VHZ78_14895 [Rhizomicrobium sp.]|jgi:hypothetical protein|nr:hypothetical protein [Rhizomicrobium sp.]